MFFSPMKKIVLLAMVLCVWVPTDIFAQQIIQPPPLPSPPIDICNVNLKEPITPPASGDIYDTQLPPHAAPYGDSSYTEKVVQCLRGSIVTAAIQMLDAISRFMKPLVGIMVTFAIVMLGMRILSGEREVTRTVIAFLLKLGLITMFAFNLGGLAGSIFGIEDQMINLVSLDTLSPWQRIDIFVGKLLGFGPHLFLFQGLLGIIGGALVSSTMGIILFISGFVALLEILTFIIRTAFTYLTSYLVLAFMIVLSPLIIPMALFFYTERYFQKWTAMLIAAMITPMMLVAFIQPFIGVFMVLIAGIFGTLGFPCEECTGFNHCDLTTACHVPVDFSAYQKLNQPLLSWLVPGDASFDQLLTIVNHEDLSDPAVQTNINPMQRRAMDIGANVPGIDFGSNNIAVIQQLVFQFISLWIFASLIKSMVEKIPDIAASIAGTVSGISMESFSFKRAASESVQNFGIGAANFGIYKAGGLKRL